MLFCVVSFCKFSIVCSRCFFPRLNKKYIRKQRSMKITTKVKRKEETIEYVMVVECR